MAKNNPNKKDVFDPIADAIEAGTYKPPRQLKGALFLICLVGVIWYGYDVYRGIIESAFDSDFIWNFIWMIFYLGVAGVEYKKLRN